jgi:hypothetical protein
MIELPHGFLNALFVLLVVFANANQSRQRSGKESALAPQSAKPYRWRSIRSLPPIYARNASGTATEPSAS